MIGTLDRRIIFRLTVSILAINILPCTTARAQERMQPIPAEKMTEAQKKAVADYKMIRGTDLSGPYSVILRVPSLVVPSVQIRLHYLNDSSLDQKLTEFATLIAARRWTSNYEWNAHSNAAIKAGLKPEIIAAIAEGRRPEQMAQDEEVVYDFCTELQFNQSVSDHTYARSLQKLGEPGIIEMASIQGFYTYLAMIINTARMPIPANAKPALERFPRVGLAEAGR